MEKGYRVIVDDNFHYMNEDERWELGEYATFEEALAASQKLVKDFFEDADLGQTAKELYDGYVMMGDDPWIEAFGGAVAPPERFSAWAFAKDYAERISKKSPILSESQKPASKEGDIIVRSGSHDLEDWQADLVETYIGLGMVDEAVRAFKPIWESHPQNFHVLWCHWKLNKMQKRYKEMILSGWRLVSFYPEKASSWTAYGEALRMNGRLEDAIAKLLEAADHFPAEADFPYNLACYSCLLGRINEARGWLNKAAEFDPEIWNEALKDPDLEPLKKEIESLLHKSEPGAEPKTLKKEANHG
jgi:tetratricopeptide (TPR) repeat protein